MSLRSDLLHWIHGCQSKSALFKQWVIEKQIYSGRANFLRTSGGLQKGTCPLLDSSSMRNIGEILHKWGTQLTVYLCRSPISLLPEHMSNELQSANAISILHRRKALVLMAFLPSAAMACSVHSLTVFDVLHRLLCALEHYRKLKLSLKSSQKSENYQTDWSYWVPASFNDSTCSWYYCISSVGQFWLE